MFCYNCGKSVDVNSKFCISCGAPVTQPGINYQNQNVNAQQGVPYYMSQQPAYVPSKKNESIWMKMNLFAIICAIILAVGTILPFASVNVFGMGNSTSLIDGSDGWIVIALALATIGFSIRDLNIGIMIVGVLAALLVFYDANNLNERIMTSEYGYLVQKGAGVYLMIIASVGIVLSAIIKMAIKTNK